MKIKITGHRILLILFLFLMGCKRQIDTAQPPEILYGEDVCARCNMIISEENMAAAYWTDAGEARRFDDIGGMMAYYQESDDAVATWWVHDLNTGEWLPAEAAYFVMRSGLMTPMGFGIVAVADKQTAAALAYGETEAMVVEFPGLMTHTMNDDMMHDDHANE